MRHVRQPRRPEEHRRRYVETRVSPSPCVRTAACEAFTSRASILGLLACRAARKSSPSPHLHRKRARRPTATTPHADADPRLAVEDDRRSQRPAPSKPMTTRSRSRCDRSRSGRARSHGRPVRRLLSVRVRWLHREGRDSRRQADHDAQLRLDRRPQPRIRKDRARGGAREAERRPRAATARRLLRLVHERTGDREGRALADQAVARDDREGPGSEVIDRRDRGASRERASTRCSRSARRKTRPMRAT